MHTTQSTSARIMLIATLVSGFAAMGWTQGTNRYTTGGNYAVGAPTNTRYLMQMTTTNALNQGDNNLVWSHSGRYLATARTPANGVATCPYVNLIGFGKTGSITNLGSRSTTNDWIYPNTMDFTWNDDRVLFVNPNRDSLPRWLRIMSCITTGDTEVATVFFSAPATVSNHVYSPSVIYDPDPVIQKERLLFLVSNSTNSPPAPSPINDDKPSTRVNVYTVSYNSGNKPATNWADIKQLTAFTNNFQIPAVNWCPELGTNFQPLVNRYAILVPNGSVKKLYVFTGVRAILDGLTVAPSNFADPRFTLRETNVCGNSQMTWTFDGDFLMYGVNVGTTSQLYSVRSEGADTNRVLFPTPGNNAFQNKQWLCISPNGMRGAFTINKQLFLLPLQCDNVAQTNAGTTNIITDGSYTKVVIPGSVLPHTSSGLTNYTFTVMEPSDVDTNRFPSEYAGNAREFGVSGVDTQVNFLTDVEMSLHFEDSDVPDGVSATNLSIFLFNPTNVQSGYTGTWTQVASQVDTNTHYVMSTNIQHFSVYAIGRTLEALAVPTAVTASKGTFVDKVQVAWNSVTNASEYTVWRSETNDTHSAALVAGGITTTNYDNTNAVVGTLYYYWVKATDANGTSAFSSSDSGWRADICAGVCADYDGDGLADPAIYDEATGTWRIKLSGAGYYLLVTTLNGLGGPGYASVSADYDGDRKADPAVYHELTGRWIILPSTANYSVVVILSQTLGGIGYSGIPADYDGDRLADPGVYERNQGDWKVMLSTANYSTVELLGLLGGTGYRAVAADYDGDRLADPAIYDENDGYWIFKLSSIGYVEIALTQTLGGTGYIPVPADYDGDGLADLAVKSETGNGWIVMFSSGNYTPVPLTIIFE